MLNVNLDDFMFELKDGAIKHVGPSTTTAEAKLFDVEDVEVRAFGDKRAKLAFEDEDGNLVEVSLFPEHLQAVASGVEALESDTDLFE